MRCSPVSTCALSSCRLYLTKYWLSGSIPLYFGFVVKCFGILDLYVYFYLEWTLLFPPHFVSLMYGPPFIPTSLFFRAYYTVSHNLFLINNLK